MKILFWTLGPPWISVCSNCQQWRPKESTDEADWKYPYKDYPPRTPNVSHGLCESCHTELYCRNGEGKRERRGMALTTALEDDKDRDAVGVLFDIVLEIESNYRGFFEKKILALVETSVEGYQDAKATVDRLISGLPREGSST